MAKKIKLENWVYMFFMFQIVVNIYRTFFGDNIKLLGFSMFEMINTFFIIGLWCYVALKLKDKKVLGIIAYFFVLGGYCIVHYMNISKFNMDIFQRTMYGLIQESYYIFRVYGLPVLLIFTLIYGGMKKEFFVRMVRDIAVVISGVIVVTNFLGVSICTYAGEGHTYLIHGSFFDWFSTTGVENMKLFTSVGWFPSGNEISGILLMTLPVIVYQFLECRTIATTARFAVSMLAMMMIGTKTATLGSCVVFVAVGMAWMIVELSGKKFKSFGKSVVLILCVLVVWGGLFYYSPFWQNEHPHVKASAEEQEQKEEEEELEEEEDIVDRTPVQLSDKTEEEREQAIDYITNNYWNHYVNAQFIKNYPIEKDLPFWIKVINRDSGINQNYRGFKKELLGRIVERNGQSLDKLVGIGVFNEIDCEQDYVYQYFMFGIAGVVLFLGIYILIFVKSGIQFLLHIKQYWNAEFISYMCALAIALALPYVTGHLIGMTMTMFQIVLLSVLVEKTVKEGKSDEGKCNSSGI